MSHRLHIWTVGHVVVCVPADVPDAVRADLRALLGANPSVDGVLEMLTAGGLAATPPFVCAAAQDAGVRVVIRGDLEVVAHGRDGSSLVLSAGRSATWNDDVVTDIAALSVGLDDGGRFEWLAVPAAVPAAPTGENHTARPPAPVAEPDLAPGPVGDLAAGDGGHREVVEAAPVAGAGDGPPAVAEPAHDGQQSHTLDEEAFLSVVADGDDARAAPELAELDRPAAAPPLDFSSLLEHTHHGEVASAPPPPAPPPAPPPPPPAIDLPPPPTAQRQPVAPTATPVPPTAPSPGPGALTAPVRAIGVAPPPPLAPMPGPPPAPGSPLPPPPPSDAGTSTGLGEHDGRTITLADLRRQQDGSPSSTAPVPAELSAAEVQPPTTLRPGEVRAVRCSAGHANPPTAVACRLCRAPVTDRAIVAVPRPVVAQLVFDSGLVVDVDRPQLIGRRPTAPPHAEEIPNLVTIPSPDAEISRAHTAVRVAGWDVLIEDVGSTNGTEVALPGRDPVRLREHEPVLVVPGTQVTLAGAVRFRIDAPEA